MARVKITVLKRLADPDLIARYADKVAAPCPKFVDGQEFFLDRYDKPEGFCSWAWADIHRDAMVVALGGSTPHVVQPGTAIVCCTDAFRPVVFKIERVE